YQIGPANGEKSPNSARPRAPRRFQRRGGRFRAPPRLYTQPALSPTMPPVGTLIESDFATGFISAVVSDPLRASPPGPNRRPLSQSTPKVKTGSDAQLKGDSNGQEVVCWKSELRRR